MDGWNFLFPFGGRPIFQVVQPNNNVKDTKPETFHPSEIKPPYKVSTPPEPINTHIAYVHLPYKSTIHVGKYASPMDPMC